MALYYFGNHPHAKRADGTKINTRAHYDYICRQGLYANMKGKKEDLVFTCSGNLQGISRLVEGMKPEDAIQKLKGIRCGFKPTSCPDQLARALESMQ